MDTNSKKKLGEKIKGYRLKRNYKQSFMASKLGISQGQYGKIENGQVSVTIDRLKNIAEVLEISIIDLLMFSEFDDSERYKDSFFNVAAEQSGSHSWTIRDQQNQINNLYDKISFLQKENNY